MQKNYLKLFLLFTVLLSNTSINAQETTFDKGTNYIIGGIEVTGVVSFNKQTIVTYTGLRKGQEIKIPGEQLSAVIQKLWKLELFSDIKFFLTDVQGNTAFLELYIQELPTLSEVKVQGIKKKGKIDDLLKKLTLKKAKKSPKVFLPLLRTILKTSTRKTVT